MQHPIQVEALLPAAALNSTNSIAEDLYGYIPARDAAITHLVNFVFSLIMILYNYYRMDKKYPRVLRLFVTSLIICALLEIVGWTSRLASSVYPDSSLPYQLQLVTTLVAPSYMAHMAMVMAIFALSWSLDNPLKRDLTMREAYFALFMSVVTFEGGFPTKVLLTIGAILTATEVNYGKSTTLPGRLIFIGMILHLVVLAFLSVILLQTILLYRYKKELVIRKSSKKLIICVINVFGMILLLIRLAYRFAALHTGLASDFSRNEEYFNRYDGAMVTVALGLFNLSVGLDINCEREDDARRRAEVEAERDRHVEEMRAKLYASLEPLDGLDKRD